MTKKYIVYYPNPGGNIRVNLYVGRMIDVLSEHYQVVGLENISNDICKIKQVKCVILNWMESNLDSRLKRRLYLYRLYKVKIYWVFHNKLPHDCEELQQIKNMHWLADFCDHIILLSEASRKYLPHYKRNKKKGILVPLINYADAYPKCSNKDIRKKYNIGEEKIVFTFLGILRPYKNIDLIINAFQELSLPDAVLLIAGKIQSNKFKSNLLEMAEKNEKIILDLGFVSNGEMEAYLHASDILVLPYDMTSSMNSSAMIMAFSYGRTVIIPKMAMAEDIIDNNIAFIYDYSTKEENYDALKDKMYKAYQAGRRELIKMGCDARDYVDRFNGKAQIVEALQKAGVL